MSTVGRDLGGDIWAVGKELPCCGASVGLETESLDPTLAILARESENREARFDQSDCIPAPRELNAAFVSEAACAMLTGRGAERALAADSREVCRVMLTPSLVGSVAAAGGLASDFVISTGAP